MSQIQIATQHAGVPVAVVIGWDRPLQSCFIGVPLSDEQAENPQFEGVVALACEALTARDLSVEDITAMLANAGLVVPAAALAELAQHVEANAGNTVVAFDGGGQRTVLLS